VSIERAKRRDAIAERTFLRCREDVTALHTGEIATVAILLEDEIAMTMWARFEQ
jgi:hypothetical protein